MQYLEMYDVTNDFGAHNLNPTSADNWANLDYILNELPTWFGSAPTGLTLYFPAGNYYFSKTIKIPTPTSGGGRQVSRLRGLETPIRLREQSVS